MPAGDLEDLARLVRQVLTGEVWPALADRHAYRVGPDGQPWAFLKEISSDGNVSTVDVLFPASPAWIYADPGYLALLLEPPGHEG